MKLKLASLILNTFLGVMTVHLAAPSAHAQLIINEVMQSNIDCIMDDLNDFPDSWVELYNIGPDSVSLDSYSISDKDKPERAYRLPKLDVNVGEHVMIYCDKVGSDLHTPFRLESGKGCSVYLYIDGELTDSIVGLKKQPAPNIAYGRKEDGADIWGYMAVPTPGEANCGKILKNILAAPVYNFEGGVYSEPLSLFLTLPEDAPEDTRIVYTTDGSEPTVESLEFTDSLYIDTSTVVRAKLVNDDYLSPRSTVNSFLFVNREIELPIVSIVTDNRYFYDEEIGIYTENNNSFNKLDYRRPINFEYFVSKDAPAVINQLMETKVKGGGSRDYPLKSLVFYANKRFGEKRLNYEFFPDDAPGIDEWKSIELRNAGQDYHFLYLRDAWIQRIFGRNCDLDWQAYQPAIVYVNGKYIGMLNFRSRANEDFIYTYYDGLEDIFIVEDWGHGETEGEGAKDAFRVFRSFYNTHHSFDEFNERMDIEEFTNYMIANIFSSNQDWPSHNMVMWKPMAEEGKWRWICKDMDLGLGIPHTEFDFQTFNWLKDRNFLSEINLPERNHPRATTLFWQLIEDEEYKEYFIDRLSVYMGDFARSELVNKELDKMVLAIQPELPFLYEATGRKFDEELYDLNIEKAKKWIEKRVEFLYQHMQEFFELGAPVPLILMDDLDNVDSSFMINNIPLTTGSFNGKFHAGRAVRIEANIHNEGMELQGWNVTIYRQPNQNDSSDENSLEESVQTESTEDSQTEILEYDQPVLQFVMPEAAERVEVTPLFGDKLVTGLERLDNGVIFDKNAPFEIFDISGRSLGTFTSIEYAQDTLQKGVFIVKQGGVSIKWVF